MTKHSGWRRLKLVFTEIRSLKCYNKEDKLYPSHPNPHKLLYYSNIQYKHELLFFYCTGSTDNMKNFIIYHHIFITIKSVNWMWIFYGNHRLIIIHVYHGEKSLSNPCDLGGEDAIELFCLATTTGLSPPDKPLIPLVLLLLTNGNSSFHAVLSCTRCQLTHTVPYPHLLMSGHLGSDQVMKNV